MRWNNVPAYNLFPSVSYILGFYFTVFDFAEVGDEKDTQKITVLKNMRAWVIKKILSSYHQLFSQKAHLYYFPCFFRLFLPCYHHYCFSLLNFYSFDFVWVFVFLSQLFIIIIFSSNRLNILYFHYDVIQTKSLVVYLCIEDIYKNENVRQSFSIFHLALNGINEFNQLNAIKIFNVFNVSASKFEIMFMKQLMRFGNNQHNNSYKMNKRIDYIWPLFFTIS